MSEEPNLPQDGIAAVGTATSLGLCAQAREALSVAQGYGQKDFSAVLQLMRGRLSDL